jgi:hypothetical protein
MEQTVVVLLGGGCVTHFICRSYIEKRDIARRAALPLAVAQGRLVRSVLYSIKHIIINSFHPYNLTELKNINMID